MKLFILWHTEGDHYESHNEEILGIYTEEERAEGEKELYLQHINYKLDNSKYNYEEIFIDEIEANQHAVTVEMREEQLKYAEEDAYYEGQRMEAQRKRPLPGYKES